MILKSEIEKSYIEQNSRNATFQWVNREGVAGIGSSGMHVEIISGVRRCGKSTLMRQLMSQCTKKFAFFNFEDPRIFGFSVEDFTKLDEIIGNETEVYFFDEIQNVPSWEIFVRQLHDRRKKVFITGSNASLLSKELGTRLTGRNIRHELFPFNFNEFTAFTPNDDLIKDIDSYIVRGGFPEYLNAGNIEMLQNLLKDILFRDIAIRYNIKNTHSLLETALYLISNIGKPFTYNSLKKIMGMGSANTASDYLGWMEDAYLFFYLRKFNWSAQKSAINPRKVYVIDNGLAVANSLSYTEDRGRLLENLVFLELRKRFQKIYYFKEERECDFVVFENRKCSYLIQVCEELNTDNKHREIDGLTEAMRFFKEKTGFIVTKSQNDTLKVQDLTVKIISLNEFLKQISK